MARSYTKNRARPLLARQGVTRRSAATAATSSYAPCRKAALRGAADWGWVEMSFGGSGMRESDKECRVTLR